MKTLVAVLVPCVAALLLGCGDSGAPSNDTPCPIPTAIEHSAAPQADTLEGARALVSFDAQTPSRLPDGFEFVGATYFRGLCPDGVLRMVYADIERRVSLELAQSPRGIRAAGTAHERALVSGVVADVVHGGLSGTLPEGRVHVHWSNDGMSFIASSTLTDAWTFVDLLKVLDTVS